MPILAATMLACSLPFKMTFCKALQETMNKEENTEHVLRAFQYLRIMLLCNRVCNLSTHEGNEFSGSVII